MSANVQGILLSGNHAARPTSGLEYYAVYACSTHNLIYQTTDGGGTWVTWATLSTDLAVKELDFAEITSAVNITGTNEAGATTIVTGGGFTPDGSTVVEIEFYAPFITLADNTNTRFWLYDGSSSIGEIARFTTTVTGSPTLQVPMTMKRRLTPTNAAHTYGIRASSSSGTGNVQAGAGGSGAVVPAYIRVTRVSS